MKAKRALTALGILFTAAMLLAFPAPAAQGARQGLALCAEVVVPTLFPFMALSGFLALSGVGDILAWPLLPITRYLLRLPDQAAGAVLMGLIGGYPAGAKTIAALVSTGQLSPKEAERMLCCAVNAGPSFLVSAVGGAMFGSLKVGWVLLLGQVAGSLAAGGLAALGQPLPRKGRRGEDRPMAAAFVEAVSSAASAMLAACAFIVFFSVVGELIRLMFTARPGSPLYTLMIGLIEVTQGCALSSRVSGPMGLLLAAFFVGFGGLSIMGQVAAILMGSGVHLKSYLLTRPLAGMVSAAVVLPFYPGLQPVMAVISRQDPPVPSPSQGGIVGAVCLVIAAAMLLVGRPKPAEFTGL
jgi:sporulation integral membrane protein YlbJ